MNLSQPPLSVLDRCFRHGPAGDRRYLIVNTISFQITWLLCVTGGNLVAGAVTAVVVALHLKVVPDRRAEAVYLILCALVGFVCDLLLVQTGVLHTGSGLPPLWLTCLWVLFGSTVGYARRLFYGRLLTSAVAGAVFAPLSYFGGARLADVPLMQPEWVALLIIAAIWALIFPLLIHIYTLKWPRIT